MFRFARSPSNLLRVGLILLLAGAVVTWSSGQFGPDVRVHHLSASLGTPVARADDGSPAPPAPQQSTPSSAAENPAAVRRAETAALRGGGHWIAAWGAAAQPPSPADPISERGFRGATLREIVFTSVGGSLLRVRFTNEFGRRPLVIARAAVGVTAGGPDVVAQSSRKLSFGGHPNVTLAPGGTAVSDPIILDVPALSRLAVSLYLRHATGPASQIAQSHQTNWIASGSRILNPGWAFSRQTGASFFLDGVDMLTESRVRGAVAVIGDSITAGVGTGPNSDASWPDDLARRLQDLPGQTMSVVDLGIGGNRVLNDSSCCGLAAVQRFAPDVLGRQGVRDVILLEGINDIGYSRSVGRYTRPHTDVSAAQIIAGLRRIIAVAHDHRLRIFGGTLLPFRGAHYWSPAGERKRELVNYWITTSGAFDGVIDFARLLRDPARPLHLNPAYDSGDHLHPNAAGYQQMADAVDLAELLQGGPAHR